MDALMLEGWTPILFLGIVFAVGMFIISYKVSKKVLFSITIILSLICIAVLIYSLIGVGGWKGMGIGILTISVLIGVWTGTIIGSIFKIMK